MCEFCVQHGEGEKWYLQAKNYSEDLLADLSRQRMIRDFSRMSVAQARREVGKMGQLDRAPTFIRWALTRRITRRSGPLRCSWSRTMGAMRLAHADTSAPAIDAGAVPP